jgi:putative membrane protein
MRILALILVALIAALHSYIAYFEIFAWETAGPRVFSNFPADMFAETVTLAANQGMYNAFLAAGLIWALLIKDRIWQANVATCFLAFVIVAGCFGAYTVSMRILIIQAVPAGIALILLILSRPAWSYRT